MATRQIVIDLADIETVRFHCSTDGCGAVVEFPVETVGGELHGCQVGNHRAAPSEILAMQNLLENLMKCRNDVKLSFVIPDIPL